ncbi:MAG: glyoxalase/bleomycin resistance/dioxygenase family protein [Alphaproteobacteria bacterium]|nr:glyoxalase/bleomycin resistance/dioxygenase family protein [Alphaproteobacteria bacterium]
MTKLHVHVHVTDLSAARRYYSALFAAEPVRIETDYLKWDLADPGLNFAVSLGAEAGLSHLGFDLPDDASLQEFATRAADAGATARTERDAACCYAVSDKEWLTDPAGLSWELFHSKERIDTFFGQPERAPAPAGACCGGCG